MMNLSQMLKQAQDMQAKMADMQAGFERMEITGFAGGALVDVTLNGKGEMRALKIDPSLFEGGGIEILEDLIVAAHNDAKSKVEVRVAEEMAKLTGGLDLPPGMKLPF